jgi:hypothetical protein
MWKGVFSNPGLQIIFSNTIFMKRFLYLLHQFACHFFSIERRKNKIKLAKKKKRKKKIKFMINTLMFTN